MLARPFGSALVLVMGESTARLGSFKDPNVVSFSRLGYECMVLSSSMVDQSYATDALWYELIVFRMFYTVK
ncbi:hypothetical protein J14TS5_33600 [Paenibacillus lautus]|nr:hypothetical protein J14TS5_33600 [Paenibacillus lautus]